MRVYLFVLVLLFQDSNEFNIVTEHLSGGDFQEHLTKNKPLCENVARYSIAEIVLALEYLHTVGIIFRDLKPANIVIDSEGHLKLIDFGFAFVTHNYMKAYYTAGTPLYMAPELVKGKARTSPFLVKHGYGQAVDCWALGVMLHYMITGNDLFKNDKLTPRDDWYNWVEHASLDFLDKLNCSDSLKDLLKNLIERDENKRYTIKKVKEHAWFKDAAIDWDKVYNKTYDGQFPPK